MLTCHSSERRLFRFKHTKREKKRGLSVIDASLSCIGLSIKPLKALILDILENAHQSTVSQTPINWPANSKFDDLPTASVMNV